MPSKSPKQRRFMRAAANNPKFAKKAGIKQKVAREFVREDKKVAKKGAGTHPTATALGSIFA